MLNKPKAKNLAINNSSIKTQLTNNTNTTVKNDNTQKKEKHSKIFSSNNLKLNTKISSKSNNNNKNNDSNSKDNLDQPEIVSLKNDISPADKDNFENFLSEKIQKLENKLKSNLYNQEENSNVIKQITENGWIDELSGQVPSYIFLPSSKVLKYWNIVLYISSFYSMMMIPIEVGFRRKCLFNDSTNNIFDNFNLAFTVIFIFDVALRFFVASYSKKGEIDYSLKNIFNNYVFGSFPLDVCSAIPWEYFDNSYSADQCGISGIDTFGNKFLILIGLVRIIKLKDLENLIEKSTTKHINVIRLAQILFFFYYTTHLFGCILVGNTAIVNPIKALLDGTEAKTLTNFFRVYCYSILAGLILMLNTDLGVSTNGEKVLVFVTNILSMAIIANIFGFVALVIDKMNSVEVQNNKALRDKIDLLNEYLLYENIEGDTRNEINDIIRFTYLRQRLMFYDYNLYSELNPYIKASVRLQLWKVSYFVDDSLFISNNISANFFMHALLAMKASIFNYNETITEEGEQNTDFYLVCSNSKVEVFISGVLMNTLNQGDFFGETAIFTSSKKRTATVISKCIGDYISIPGDDFEMLMMNYCEERNFFCNIAAKYLFLYNKIVNPEQLSNFLTNKDVVFTSILRKNLFIKPSIQKNKLFYERNLHKEDNEYDSNGSNDEEGEDDD